jgi:hypothetical protein
MVFNMAQTDPWEEYQPTTAPVGQGVLIPNEPEKPEKPTETFTIATPEQKAAAGLDPNRVYQVNSVTGEFKDVGGQPTAKLAAEDPNRAFKINSALDALKNIRKLAEQSLSVGETAGRVRETPVIGAVLGQNRADLEGALSLVNSNLIQDQLAYLAKLNPQGMATLANTENEAARLAASIANLDPNQSLDQFLTGVQRAEDYYKRQLSETGAAPVGERGAPVAGLTEALPGDRVVAEIDLKNARDLQAAWQGNPNLSTEELIKKLSAISVANVGSALTPESIAALTADTNRQIQFQPYLAPMEDVTEGMGIVEGAIETVTGSERSTPEIEATADWTTMPELNELSVAGARTGIGTMFTSPEESVAIIKANYPSVEVRQDEKGNYILRSQDGKDYGIKPGFKWSDVPRALGGILAFTPAGRAATFTGAALKSGATQAAIEGTEFAAGGEFNAQPILMATAAGPVEKIIGDVVSAALPQVTSRVRQLTGRPEVPLSAAPEAPAGMGMPPAATMAPEAPIPGATVSPAPTVSTPASRPGGGAMSTSEETIRVQRAAELPVPIELARFQRTRDFVEQQRARELAKNNEVGGPIRDRMTRQQEELRQNLDSFIQGTGSEVWNNPYEQGGVIADALKTLARRERTRTSALYKRAEKAGEMREPVDYKELTDFIAGQTPTTRDVLAPVLKAVDEQLLANDPNKTGMITLNQMEDIRKYINKVASPGTPSASFGRDLRGIIDNVTKDAGGDVYKQARASREKYAKEFEDIDLVQKVFDTKPGTTERYIGLENITDKITADGTSLDSVKHLLGLLDKAGPRGARAKRELQGSVMEKIRDQAYRSPATGESGQRLMQPAALNTIITGLNKKGKLDLIFDKKTAELLNTINDVTIDLFTAPPGSVNNSNTSSALVNMIDTLATFTVTNGMVPLPAGKIVGKYLIDFKKTMANRALRKEVKRLLD